MQIVSPKTSKKSQYMLLTAFYALLFGLVSIMFLILLELGGVP